MFTIKAVVEGKLHEVNYNLVEEALCDTAWASLFRSELVEDCSVWVGDLRVTGPIKDSSTLRRQIISNAPTLLRSKL